MALVFVSYRVREESGYATLIHRELAARFGENQVFIASMSVRPGEDFIQQIYQNLQECTVLLAVIGHEWLNLLGDAKTDWVRIEIGEALRRGIRLIPLLIESAEIPVERDLPEDISGLARYQYIRLRHYSLRSDLALLIDELARYMPVLESSETTGEIRSGRQLFRLAHTDCQIGVIPGTIRHVRDVDVWVNSENTDMQMARHTDFSISSIIRYWGSKRDGAGRVIDDIVANELESKIHGDRPVAPGTIITTGSGKLAMSNQVRFITHVAAVQGEPGAGYRQVRNIDWCVTSVLTEADRLATHAGVRSILLPMLGTGVAGADVKSTAQIMIDSIIDHLSTRRQTLLSQIYLLGYSQQEYSTLTSVLTDRTRPTF